MPQIPKPSNFAPRQIPIPFYGTLVHRGGRFVVQNCIEGLVAPAFPRQIHIEIEVGHVGDSRLKKMEGEIVKCRPNEDDTEWEVELHV
jgi:hypothetical protein